jgi:hypothetical protein
MPVRCLAYQQSHAWELNDDGLPYADTVLLGDVAWVVACPMCGAMHELPRGARENAIVSPRCLLREFATGAYIRGSHAGWKTIYADWLSRWSEAANHDRFVVRMTTLESLNERQSVKLVKRKPTQRPTARRVFQMLEGIDVLSIEQAGVRRRLILNLTDLRRQILSLFSSHVQKIYDLSI